MTAEITPFAPDDSDWVVLEHQRHYEQGEGFDTRFSPLVAGILSEFVDRNDPREQGWVARDGVVRLGCVFCMLHADGYAQLRLFYLVPQARGQGLGRLLLKTCMDWARAQGFAEMRLWTHESHAAACALYQSCGFVCESSRPVQSFGCDLVEQVWHRAL